MAGNPLAADRTWSFTTGTSTNVAPIATIDTPSSTLTWKVGDSISFSGHAVDAEDGTLLANALTWNIILHHCFTPDNCHTHQLQTFTGVSSGSFAAPDHAYPSYLEIQLVAQDSGGATSLPASVQLNPMTVDLTFASNPSGLQLTVGSTASATPFTRTVIVGSINSVSADTPQTLSGSTYSFSSWSDGGAQTHNITAPASVATLTATYTAGGGGGPLTRYLSDLSWTSMSNGWGPVEKDLSNGENLTGDGHTLTLNGQTFAKGLGAHASSDVKYSLLALGCTRFQASVGVDDEVGALGSVVFQVLLDGAKVFDSGTMTGSSVTKLVDVDVTGKAQLELVVGNGGDNENYDHADWADAKLTCTS